MLAPARGRGGWRVYLGWDPEPWRAGGLLYGRRADARNTCSRTSQRD